MKSRAISVIANEIREDWRKVYFGAEPYLEAMETLSSINDQYGCDSARDVVETFLSNAQSWRGEKAKAIKAELRKMLSN